MTNLEFYTAANGGVSNSFIICKELLKRRSGEITTKQIAFLLYGGYDWKRASSAIINLNNVLFNLYGLELILKDKKPRRGWWVFDFSCIDSVACIDRKGGVIDVCYKQPD